ncbi:MAG: prephenate dehydratase [Chloroflexi bacterium]|nr:prephenate dehydratase [Chloroflexota bacterium]
MVRVAFQGERGAFSEDALITFFSDAELSPSRYLGDVFEAVLEGRVDFGVVPVENSQAGSINDTYDLLLNYPLNIFGEINLRISHCLMALPGEKLEGIKTVYSHPQALAQCEEFLRKLKTEIVPTYDTAGSAKRIKEGGLRGCAAVASRRAAQIYGLQILAENIETNVNNYTKFFVISKQKAEPAPKSKTSLVFGTKNVPGALYACLGVFATRNINLTKLESRPSRNKPWEYIFYVDFEGHIDDKICQEVLAELEQKTNFVKILGSYPRAEN